MKNIKAITKDFPKYYKDSLAKLKKSEPTERSKLPKESGVYVFALPNKKEYVYVGRTKNIRQRVRQHAHNSHMATFAFLLAREKSGNLDRTYKKGEGSRKALMKDPKFKAEFDKARECIKNMNIYYIEEKCAIKHALLEIYLAVELETTKNNSFETT